MASNESERKQEFDEKFGKHKVGQPFSTERELVEEGKERTGTNLDLGEERSEDQLEEIEKLGEHNND